MNFEGWWRRILLIAGGIGHVIAFGIGAKILLTALHHSLDPLLYVVALTLMGAGAYPLQRFLEVLGTITTALSTPAAKPSESDHRSPDSSADGSPPADH